MSSTAPLRESRVPVVPLWRLHSGEVEAAGERTAGCLPAQRTSGLAHGGVSRHLYAPRQLEKENTRCMLDVVSRLSSHGVSSCV